MELLEHGCRACPLKRVSLRSAGMLWAVPQERAAGSPYEEVEAAPAMHVDLYFLRSPSVQIATGYPET